MIMTLRLISALAASLLAAESCSLKEDRGICPCSLSVCFGNAAMNEEVVLSIHSGMSGRTGVENIAGLSGQSTRKEALSTEIVSPAEYPGGYVKDVPRTETTVSAIQGLRKNALSGCNVIIGEGADSDKLFQYSENVDCQCEKAAVNAKFRKNWASLEISTAHYGEVSGRLEIIVSGDVDGFDMLTGRPHQGRFECQARLFDEDFGTYELNLPRQEIGKADLYIKITDLGEGKELLHCCLSSVLENAGYDWKKENLDDIRIDFDQIDCSFSVRISEWDDGPHGPVTI